MTIRTYSELIKLPTYKQRFEYLKLDGVVGMETFGSKRYLNQAFYKSEEWLRIRDYVITRDYGRDLGVEGYDISGRIHVHHMNPMLLQDVISHSHDILDPEYLITTAYKTHKAIHYGSEEMLMLEPVIRTPNDTCPWKR